MSDTQLSAAQRALIDLRIGAMLRLIVGPDSLRKWYEHAPNAPWARLDDETLKALEAQESTDQGRFTRARALALALKHSSGTAGEVVEVARVFERYFSDAQFSAGGEADRGADASRVSFVDADR